MEKSLVRYSKFLSLILRHDPAAVSIELDNQGWAKVAAVLEASVSRGFPGDLATLRAVVETNDKKRFGFNSDGSKIRARQGHSIPVDLGLRPKSPPSFLYHGTARRFLFSTMARGLQPRQRQYVHLSLDAQTASSVGRRYGKPMVLIVDAKRMHAEGYCFFLSENGVWLTQEVPAEYLSQQSNKDLE